MLRLCLGLFPAASDWATPFVLTLAIISVLWGAMMAATSSDLMRFVSYTSVSHFGFMVIGIFALTTTSITGSIFYMFNHGFSTAALFLVLGFLVRRGGRRRSTATVASRRSPRYSPELSSSPGWRPCRCRARETL